MSENVRPEPRAFSYRVGGLEHLGDTRRNEALRTGFMRVINENSAENATGTPDFVLANYLLQTFLALETAVSARHIWYLDHPAGASSD